MGRAVLTMPWGREKAHYWIDRAPYGSRVTFQGPQRTIPQNSRQWPMIRAISSQLIWHGQHYSEDEWKRFFMHAYRGEKFMPAEFGGMPVPIGHSTSNLDKDEHSEFTATIEAFAARHGVDLGMIEND